jgi:hypothetical protein
MTQISYRLSLAAQGAPCDGNGQSGGQNKDRCGKCCHDHLFHCGPLCRQAVDNLWKALIRSINVP